MNTNKDIQCKEMFTIATHITPNLMSYYIVMENCIYLNKSISVANVVNTVKKKNK